MASPIAFFDLPNPFVFSLASSLLIQKLTHLYLASPISIELVSALKRIDIFSIES